MNILVDALVRQKVITSPAVERVFRSLDRRLFCPSGTDRDIAYSDAPTTIGCHQTISAPHMHAFCLERCHAHLQSCRSKASTDAVRILDIGSGSGYLTAAFALLLEEMGLLQQNGVQVVGVDKYEELTSTSIANIRRAIPQMLQHVSIVTGNAYEYDSNGLTFDFIHCGAASEYIPPNLIQCLKKDGEMVLPVGPHGDVQQMTIVHTRHSLDGTVTLEEHAMMPVRYVPLQGE